jgi:hypothetical protein
VFRGVTVQLGDIDTGMRHWPYRLMDRRLRAEGTLDGPLDNTT